MLEELHKKHNTWLSMANGICKDSELAKDLVQDMYIKLSRYEKELNDFYVYYAIKHLFIDYLRENNKRIKAEHNHDYLFQHLETEEKENLEIPSCLSWVEQQILIHRQDKSCRDIEKEYKIHFLKVHRIENKAKEKIKLWLEEKK